MLIPKAKEFCAEAEAAELGELAATMRRGKTNFEKMDACVEILSRLDRMHRLPEKYYTAPRQGIGS